MRTSLLLPDLHLGSHDDKALRIALKICAVVKPQEIVILGDWLDAHAFNSHGSSDRREAMQAGYLEEVEWCRELLDYLESFHSVERIVYIEGNHEFRFERWVVNDGGTFGREIADTLSPKALLSVGREKRFTWVPYKTPGKAPLIHLAPGIVACHGLSTAKHAAAVHLTKVPGYSVVHGHTHRQQTHVSRCPVTNRQLVGHSPGTLAQLQPLWLAGATAWSLGVTLLRVRGQRWALQPISIEEGTAFLPDGSYLTAGRKGSIIEGVA